MIRIINTGAGLILGLQYVRLSGACPVFPECTVASQAVATGLVCAAQKGCSLPPAIDGPGESRQAWCEAPGYGSNSPRVCQPEKTSSPPLNSSRPLHCVLLASEYIHTKLLNKINADGHCVY